MGRLPLNVRIGKNWKGPGSERMDLPGRERMDLPGQNFQKKEETFVSSINPDFPH